MGKQVLAFFIGFIIAVAICLVAYNYVGDKQPTTTLQETEVTVVKEKQFTDMNQFLTYVADLRDNATIDSVLRSAPPEQIQQIAAVCINKKGYIDRELFYKEYLESYNKVYKYLPPSEKHEPEGTQTQNIPPTIRADTLASLSITKEGKTQIQQE